MTDDEFDRRLRAARPRTAADDGWTNSPGGAHVLARVHAAIRPVEPRAFRPSGRLAFGIGVAAAVAAAAGLTLLTTPAPSRPAAAPRPPVAPSSAVHSAPGPMPADMALVSYTDCTAMLDGLRAHTAAHVDANGFENNGAVLVGGLRSMTPYSGVAVPAASAQASAPAHSTTNVQEQGVGEPDVVETDGERIVAVTAGELRVVDAVTHQVTGKLDLGMYAGAANAQLLMAGNRLLVLLGSGSQPYGGPVAMPAMASPALSTTALLVDITHAPRVVDTFHTDGGYLDARMVGDTARLVVGSAPHIAFPLAPNAARNKAIVERAPITAWQPTYTVSTGTATTQYRVPCDQVSHPKSYTGTSLLTVYSLDLAGSLADPQPVTLAADGTTVYATADDLYVASSAGGRTTQLHRFDIRGSGPPRYLGSGSVPGTLLDSYSMSEYEGALRVVTTTGSQTGVYVLNAATLKIDGHVGGLGPGEQLHGVRFLGPLAYVVTFRSVDPLYVLDLRDPAHPRKAGELTVTGYSDYLHPVGDGRLLGVGQDVSDGKVAGAQVSLFDVDTPAHPTRLARIVRPNTPSEAPLDPHAFLYWPATGTAVVPIESWDAGDSGAALVVQVTRDGLRTVGAIRQLASGTGIQRSLVIGDQLWTLSEGGLQANDLATLRQDAWVPFQ